MNFGDWTLVPDGAASSYELDSGQSWTPAEPENAVSRTKTGSGRHKASVVVVGWDRNVNARAARFGQVTWKVPSPDLTSWTVSVGLQATTVRPRLRTTIVGFEVL